MRSILLALTLISSLSAITIVAPSFERETLGFNITDTEKREFHSMLESYFRKVFRKETITVVPFNTAWESITDERIVLKQLNYTTRSSSMGQRVGTLELQYEFFNASTTAEPAFATVITADGARHWGENVPYTNSLEASVASFKKEFRDYMKGK